MGNNQEQIPLFEIDEDWKKEWEGMPEFTRFDNRPAQRIVVNFRTTKDAIEFGKVIGQTVTGDTDTLWFPPYKTPTGVYVDES